MLAFPHLATTSDRRKPVYLADWALAMRTSAEKEQMLEDARTMQSLVLHATPFSSSNCSANEEEQGFRMQLDDLDKQFVETADRLLAMPSSEHEAAAAMACHLAAWAELTRERARALIKGSLATLDDLQLMRSRTRTELEALAAARSGEPLEDIVACPVCLGIVFDAVAPACGHTVCGPCYERWLQACSHLDKSDGAPTSSISGSSTTCVMTCPMCRGPAEAAAAMPHVRALARRLDPKGYASRGWAHCSGLPQRRRCTVCWPSPLRRMSWRRSDVGGDLDGRRREL